MFNYIKASMSSIYAEDIEMIVEELNEIGLKHYTESKNVEQYGEIVKLNFLHVKINTPEELQFIVERIAPGGVDMKFEFKANK